MRCWPDPRPRGSGRRPGHHAGPYRLDEAAELLPGVHDVIEYDAPWVLFDPPPVRSQAVAELLRAVEARRFDAALVLTSYHQSPLPLALLLRMAEVPGSAPSARTIRARCLICGTAYRTTCRSPNAACRWPAPPAFLLTSKVPGSRKRSATGCHRPCRNGTVRSGPPWCGGAGQTSHGRRSGNRGRLAAGR